jgi:hypothetical protein
MKSFTDKDWIQKNVTVLIVFHAKTLIMTARG